MNIPESPPKRQKLPKATDLVSYSHLDGSNVFLVRVRSATSPEKGGSDKDLQEAVDKQHKIALDKDETLLLHGPYYEIDQKGQRKSYSIGLNRAMHHRVFLLTPTKTDCNHTWIQSRLSEICAHLNVTYPVAAENRRVQYPRAGYNKIAEKSWALAEPAYTGAVSPSSTTLDRVILRSAVHHYLTHMQDQHDFYQKYPHTAERLLHPPYTEEEQQKWGYPAPTDTEKQTANV